MVCQDEGFLPEEIDEVRDTELLHFTLFYVIAEVVVRVLLSF
jgi:hypothetical protein